MLIDKSLPAAQAAPANVGLTAYQVAVVQAKVLQETLKDVSARQAENTKEQQARAEERRERQRAAEERGGVDIVVGGSDRSTEGNSKPLPDAGSLGGKADIEV